MSVQLISKSIFALEPVKEGGYELSIKFLDQSEGLVSAKKFTFFPKKASKEEGKVCEGKSKEVLGGELLDVYSQNGACSPDILAKLFTNGDEQGVKKAAKMLQASAFKGPTILVLDLRDPDTGYQENQNDTIAKCERVVCDFFKSQTPSSKAGKHAKKIHSLLAPDFVLCEGQLKMDLLQCGGFSASETAYFHTPSGAKSFCQCAEFFMNAFKLGETAQGAKGALLADKYIVPVGRFASFKPCTKSTVLYPSLYKDLYAIDGDFAKMLGTVYSVSGKYDAPSKITTMSVTKK